DSHDHDRSLSPHLSAGSSWTMTPMGGRGVRAGLSLHPRPLRGEMLRRPPRVLPRPWWGLRPLAPQQERPGDLPPVTGGIPQHLSHTVPWATPRGGGLAHGPLGPWGYAPGE